jgi:hypothetical protein
MDLPDFRLAVINTTREAKPGLTLRSRVVSLDNRLLAQRSDKLTAAANAVTPLAPLDISKLLDKERMLLVSLSLTDAAGAVVSENSYWQGRDEASHRRLNELPRQSLLLTASISANADERVLTVQLANRGNAPALAAKLTLVDDQGVRILPAYYSDNYVTLLPGESRRLDIRFPAAFAGTPHINLRGWNIEPATVSVSAH